MFQEVFERFTAQAPVSVMARLTMAHVLDGQWVDELFEQHRQRQYARELLFSTVVELMLMVSLGQRASLHAAAQAHRERIPVSISALYDKVNRTEPGLMRALVSCSAARLAQLLERLPQRETLPGWRLRVLDGNHLPASEKRVKPLREVEGAALPGHTLVVYDPDQGLVTDLVCCEDAYAQERSQVGPLLALAQPGEVWLADRNFCTQTILSSWQAQGASFIVREHGRPAAFVQAQAWRDVGRCETGKVYEQPIQLQGVPQPWRRIELRLDTATQSGDSIVRVWSNLPATISAPEIATLYKRRWRIEGMFQRLEADLKSEVRSLGHPRAALLGFAVAVLADNLLVALKHLIEQAHQAPGVEVSTYYIASDIQAEYAGMMIALPPPAWQPWTQLDSVALRPLLLQIARYVDPRRLKINRRGPKKLKTKCYTDSITARKHVSTARILQQAAF